MNMDICDCCGHLTAAPERHPGPYGVVRLCPLCAGLGAVAHLTVAADGEGEAVRDAIADGMSQSEVSRIVGVDRLTIRKWIA